MPRLSSRRRRRSDLEEGDNSDGGRNNGSSPASDSSKRRRLDSDSMSEDEGLSTVHGKPMLVNGSSRGGPSDEFQPGAIVRVAVQNFVTYEKAEFFPGPHLNMVIGPNGTGKSSLVCAICLGLGYSPKHLGRAAAVKEFVKNGKDMATIEIELQKNPNDRSNYVIRVQIRREQNSQKWWLNGKETSHKSIQELMRSLKIQVDNLCQFLPQDRVVEFAACTPVDLLHETLRAAAPEEMLEWQAKLQELHKEKNGLSDAVHTDVEQLQSLENRQQGLQADVERIREREEIQKNVKDLQSALVLANYQDAREKHNQARDRKKEAERELRQLERDSGPSLEAVNRKQEYVYKIEQALPAKLKALHDASNAAQSVSRDVTAAAEEVREMSNRLDSEQKGFEMKKKELAASRSKITAFQADLKNRPSDFNPADWNQKIRGEEHTMRELESEQRQITSEMDSLKDKARVLQLEERKLRDDIEALDTQQGQQLNFMRKHFADQAAAWDWIQAHQSDFQKEVLGPPMISCSVKDERYSNQIQSLLQMDDFLCFTTQTKDDHRRLTNQLYREMSLSVVIRTRLPQRQDFKAPVEHAEAAELGLDGFAIDYLEGPEPVLAMLCAEKRLHQSGVAIRDHDDATYDRLINHGKISQWATAKQSFTVRRRKEYGPQAMTTVTKNIRPGRFWTSQPIDAQEKLELERKVVQSKGERDMLKEEHQGLQAKYNDIDDKKASVSHNIERLRKDKNALQKEYQKWQSLPEKIESEERAKATHEQAMRDARKNVQEIEYDWDKSALRRAKLAIRHKRLIDKIREAHMALMEARIWLLEGNSDVDGLKDRNSSIMERLELERRNVQEATEETNRARELGRRLGESVKDVLAEEDADRELLTQLAEGKSPQDVQNEISAEEAKLELIHAANPGVIQEFERRAEEIARLKRKMEGSSDKLDVLNKHLEELTSKWEPKLEELVSQINNAFAYNFEQISCAGEVRVHKDEDFSQWALDVMVKFRENEALQKLTAHRQSGGERAVSTIFYLMALQSMAQSPFRVVDEINQGMDPRNERMVHERMVEIACREHTSQYFLITPKLLTELRYDPKMRVLCIASGEHMPKEGGKLDFRRCLEVQKRLAAAA